MTEQNCYGDGTVFEGVKSKDSSIQTWFVSVGFGRTTMTDKELIELAAKAAGITGEYDSGTIIMVCDSEGEEPEKLLWNPLTSDALALRLAVKLGITVSTTPNPWQENKSLWVCFNTEIDGAHYQNMFDEDYGDDPYAATRRAIVRAAAEIGRTL